MSDPNGYTDKPVFGVEADIVTPRESETPPPANSGELAGLGRLRQVDARNAKYQMPKLSVPGEVRRKLWHAGTVLDQKDTPQCVGYSGWQWLASGPTTNKPPFSPTDLYHWAQDNDEWPGSDYEGSSTLGLMKALKSRGYIGEYVWALDAETVAAWVLSRGPTVVGTNWFNDMFTPDKEGFLEAAGQNVGGHEWTVIGFDRDKKWKHTGEVGAFRMVNSWGKGWGDGGRAWVSLKTLDRLIKDQGEAVTATEFKVR